MKRSSHFAVDGSGLLLAANGAIMQMILEKPLVSCIVTCFNKVGYLYEAIDSVFAQDYPAIELIVADDGTEHFPTEEIEGYLSENKTNSIQNTLVIHHEVNIGTVRNINAALKRASGEFLINLDGDDVFYNEFVISKMIDYMLENGLDFLECSKLRCDEHLNEYELLPTPDQKKSINKLNTARKQYHSFALLNFYNIGGGSGVAYTKDCVRRLGLFNEAFRNWQDGPTLIAYVEHGKMIPTNFDIIAIRYREGGVSNKPENNKQAFSHIAKDRALFIEKFTIPDKWNPHFLQRRKKTFWCLWEQNLTKIQRAYLIVKYPEIGFIVLMKKMSGKAIR